MTLNHELCEFSSLLMDVMSLYYRCNRFDGQPSMVAQLEEALNKLMEEARKLGGLGQAIRLATEEGMLYRYRNPMKLVERIEKIYAKVREQMATFKKIGLEPDNESHDHVWIVATSPLLYSRSLWKGRMSLERLKEMVRNEEGEGLFYGDEDAELLWRVIQVVKTKMLEKRVSEQLKKLHEAINMLFNYFLEAERGHVLELYEEYRWLMEELGKTPKSLEAVIAEAWGAGCAKLLLDWDDSEVRKDRKTLDEFMTALRSARDWHRQAEEAESRLEAISNLMRARYFADKLRKILPEAEAVAKKYAGYLRFIREAEEVLRSLEEVKVSEEDYEWVRMELEGDQDSLDKYLVE